MNLEFTIKKLNTENSSIINQRAQFQTQRSELNSAIVTLLKAKDILEKTFSVKEA